MYERKKIEEREASDCCGVAVTASASGSVVEYVRAHARSTTHCKVDTSNVLLRWQAHVITAVIRQKA